MKRKCFFTTALLCGIAFAITPLAAQQQHWSGLVVTANEAGRSVNVVDSVTLKARTVRLPVAPHNVQVSADGRYLYATGMKEAEMAGMDMDDSGFLLQYDLRHVQNGPIMDLPVGKHPAHVVTDRENRFAYVTVSGENAVKVIDLARKSVAAVIPVGKMPHGLRMSADERRIYVSNMNEETVSVLDVALRKEIARVRVGKHPVQVAIAPNGKTVYVTLAGQNALAIVDAAAGKLLKTVGVGSNPAQVYIAPDGARVYVANQGTEVAPDHTVSVIDTAARKVLATVNVASGAHGVVVSPDSAQVFVTCAFDSKMAVIDARTLGVRFVNLGQGPNGVTLTPGRSAYALPSTRRAPR